MPKNKKSLMSGFWNSYNCITYWIENKRKQKGQVFILDRIYWRVKRENLTLIFVHLTVATVKKIMKLFGQNLKDVLENYN